MTILQTLVMSRRVE